MKQLRMPRVLAMLLVAAMLLNFALINPGTVSAEVPDIFTYIEVGDTRDVTISYSGEAEYFCFIPEASGTYTFYSSDRTCDPVAGLLDADGYWLAGDDDTVGLDFSLTYDLVAGATYYLEAAAYGTGTYNLHLVYGEENLEPEYTDIREDESVYLSNLEEAAYFRFIPESSGYYTFYTSGSDCEPWATLFDGGWYELTVCEYSDVSNFSLSWYMEAGVIYYLATGMYSSGSYTLNLVYNELEVDYTDIYVGDSHSVIIDTEYGCEYFRFIPETSGTYTFYSSDCSGDPKGYLLDRAGNELTSDDDTPDSSNFSLTYDFVAGEIYYLQAAMWSDYTGSYILNLVTGEPEEELWEPEYFTDIFVGDIKTVTMDESTMNVFFRLIPEVDGYYTFASSDATVGAWGEVLDQYGYVITEIAGGDGTNFIAGAYLETGNIYYLVTGMDEPGSFTLTLGYDEELEQIYQTNIAVGDSLETVASGEDSYFFFCPAVSGTYTFYSSDSNCNPYAYLLDGYWWEQLAYSDDAVGEDFSITYYLVAGEWYYLQTGAYESGTYYVNLAVEEVECPDIYVGDSHSLVFYDGDPSSYFRFVPEVSGAYTFYSSDSDGDPKGYLLNENWDVLMSGDDSFVGPDFAITYDLVAGETYYLQATTWNNCYGTYTLNLVFAEDYEPFAYTDIFEGETREVIFETADGEDIQYFRFIPTVSGYYSFCSSNAAADHAAALVTMYGDDLAYAEGLDGNGFDIVCYLEAGEIYYLMTAMNGPGSYLLDVSYLEDYVPEEPDYIDIHAGEGVYLGYLEDVAYFRFVPDASGYYTFYSSNSTCDPWAVLYDDTWGEIEYSDNVNGYNFVITYYLEAGVTYYYVVGMYTSGYCDVNLIYGELEVEPWEPDSFTDIYVGESQSVNIYDDYVSEYFRFIPETSGYYTFYSSDRTCDPWAYLLDEYGSSLYYCDDYDGLNFSITYYLEAGKIYYLQADAYSSGTYTLNLVAGESEDQEPEYTDIYVGDSISFIDLVNTRYFRFIPEFSGYYTFYSSDCYCDPWGALMDASWSELAYSDNYDGNSFSITYYLEAGVIYYYATGMYDVGSYTLNLVAGEQPEDPEGPDWPEYEPGDADLWDGTVAGGFGGGTGTQSDPYLIYTAEQLAYLAYSTNNGNSYYNTYFKLMNDLDLNNLEWTPIGYGVMTYEVDLVGPYFEGYFDGNYHVVYNLHISDGATSYNGLFGDVYGGEFANLGIINAYVYGCSDEGKRMNNGALAGRVQNTNVMQCFVKNAEVFAFTYDDPANAGLLLGNLREDGLILNCYAQGSATTNASAGGLIGACYSVGYVNIVNSYVWANVTHQFIVEQDAADVIGGFCGFTSEGEIAFYDCFFTGRLSGNGADIFTIADDYASVTWDNCYYSTNYADFYQGLYVSESELQSQSWILSNLSWDFSSVWAFMDGETYPVLQGFVLNGSGGGDGHIHTPGDWIVDQEPTCTTSGSKHTECTECGCRLESVYIPALTHDYQSEVTREATCTEPGVVTHTCTRCDDSYMTYIYSQHSYSVTARQEATCTVDGFITYTCSNCGDSYNEIIEGGHRYIAEITLVATPTSDGEVRYTCENCGDSYVEVIPARPDAKVLLIQDRLPWSENNNVSLLNKMQADGYITGWDMTTTSSFNASMLASYGVVLIANDQTTATYNQLRDMQDALVSFANAGGVVIYGACDEGWAAGTITYTLPEGAEKTNYYSNYNYIVDPSHPVVTGIYTDGKALTNTLLYGTYCSHTSFSNLPAGSNVILQDGHGNPTLVEYPVGNGHVILSGLTWEFYYTRNVYNALTDDTFTKNVYDDLILYALQLSDPCDHAYDAGVVVEPTCTEQGYTLHTCSLCGGTMRDTFVDAYDHVPSEWTIVDPATTTQEGLMIVYCEVCGETLEQEIIPMLNAPVIYMAWNVEDVILGQTFDVYIYVEDMDPVKSAAFVPVYDTDLFELVSVQWLQQATIQTVDPEIISAWNVDTDINGHLLTLTFRAKGLTSGSRITSEAYVQNDNGLVQVSVVGCSFAVVECYHEQWQISSMGELGHLMVCSYCGMNELVAHTFDHGCDNLCDDCGYERETAHVSDGQLYCDDFTHWEICSECYATMNTHRHEFEDINDCVCETCGYIRPLRGDVDGDGNVDSDDAILLLMHFHFPENYYLNQHGDMDGNGVVDSDDSIYLLMYTYFSEEYPLYDPYVK